MSCDFCDVEDTDFTSCQTCFSGVCFSCRSRCSTCMETICPDCDIVENDGFCKSCLTNENKSTSEDEDDDDKNENDNEKKTK